jgi:hypothetical protein
MSCVKNPENSKGMSATFLAAAAVRAASATAATTASAFSAGGRSGGLLAVPGFFDREKGAPLLRRNAGFLSPEGLPDGWRARLDGWPALAGATLPPDQADPGCEDEAALRIFLRDAERTFQDEGHRTQMIELLKRVWPENRDYHQGLGYVASLLMLFFDTETIVRILLRLTHDQRYTPGYWKAAPEAYVRDAMVYARLVEERFPAVATKLQSACIVPEAYASKWFIGLCVHVLPYASLLRYIEAFLTEGYVFLFKFALALVETLSPKLLALKASDVNIMLELLRLDTCHFPDNEENEAFFLRLVADAQAVELDRAHVDALRVEEGEKLDAKMKRTREREAQLAAEAEDDEIVFSDEVSSQMPCSPLERVLMPRLPLGLPT